MLWPDQERRRSVLVMADGAFGGEGKMAGLKDKRGFIDKDRLDLSERKAVEYWMKRWV